MKIANREMVSALRSMYPAGTRVELISMNDPQAPPAGTTGTITGIDDIGDIMVSWNNGSSLNVIPGEDVIKIIQEKTK